MIEERPTLPSPPPSDVFLAFFVASCRIWWVRFLHNAETAMTRLLTIPTGIAVGPLLGALLACNGAITDPAAEAAAAIDPADPAFCEIGQPTPGMVTVRRLNRVEYNNTVRDLLGTSARPGDAFPEDAESGDGFTNNGEVLTLDALLIEKYQTAAQELAADAMTSGSMVRARFLDCAADADAGCARAFIGDFGLRAWRRPLTGEEVDRLVAVHDSARDEGESFDGAMGYVVRAMLMSPNFLFRIERHSDPATVAALGDFEVASRLSYFLWSTMPDDELLEAAASGELQSAASLEAQVARMLSDGRAEGFFDTFAREWLHLGKLDYAVPDPELFPTFDDALRDAMKLETQHFIRHIVENDLPIATILSADFTFVNERLARHYGIEGVTGNDFRRVDLDGTRGGLLTQGSVLTATSHPNETSIVKRGEWVLDQLLCAPPPDPPADVDTFIEGEATAGLTLREKVELHRADPACASCHSIMDPIGFALENYDAVGVWREEDNGQPIDASGELPDGQTFDGAQELSLVLQEDPRYTKCVTKKLLAYALGRSVGRADRCFVEDIQTRLESSNMSLRQLIVEIVLHDVFRTAGGRVEDGR
jgi:hypothetical protein